MKKVKRDRAREEIASRTRFAGKLAELRQLRDEGVLSEDLIQVAQVMVLCGLPYTLRTATLTSLPEPSAFGKSRLRFPKDGEERTIPIPDSRHYFVKGKAEDPSDAILIFPNCSGGIEGHFHECSDSGQPGSSRLKRTAFKEVSTLLVKPMSRRKLAH